MKKVAYFIMFLLIVFLFYGMGKLHGIRSAIHYYNECISAGAVGVIVDPNGIHCIYE